MAELVDDASDDRRPRVGTEAPDESNSKQAYAAPAAACAAEVLLLLASSREPLTLAEITQGVGRTKSLSFRVLRELQKAELVARPDGSRYQLGLRALELGAAVAVRIGESSVIREALRSVAQETGQTINLGVLRGFETLIVMKQEAPRSVVTITHVGLRLPANCTALGKVLLSQLSDQEILDRMPDPLPSLTSRSTTDPKVLLAEIHGARSHGYAINREGSILGRSGISVPVGMPQLDGEVGGLAATASVDEFDNEKEFLLDALKRARETMERAGAAYRLMDRSMAERPAQTQVSLIAGVIEPGRDRSAPAT